jgi:hypothetical protein
MNNQNEAKEIFTESWRYIIRDCRLALGSELHYQAMIYHCLRKYGNVPIDQIGMNVKMWIDHPKTKLFRMYDKEKNPDFQGGFEPIPDVVLFKPSVNGDWRRRNHENTIRRMLMAIEVKASERNDGRLRPGELISDIEKLDALRQEVRLRDASVVPVMLVVDTAPEEDERMIPASLDEVCEFAKSSGIALFYLSPDDTRETGW